MYRYEKRPSKIKGFILSIFLMGISSALSIFLYRMYLNININQTPIVQESEGKAVRLSIDNEEKSNISDTLESTTKCIVGISKIKNKNDSVLETNAAQNLSLRNRNNNFRKWFYYNKLASFR
jgi:hypothetical protein